MTSPTRGARLDAAARWTAAIAGALPVAVFGATCLSRFLPVGAEARFVAGFTLAVPLWVAAVCVTSLARTGARAWLWCGSLTLILGALALEAPG